MKLKLHQVGPIDEAELTFGDLTVLVGPQASGKSIVLEMLKLMVDKRQVQGIMRQYGLHGSGKLPDFFDIYFGEGMRDIWQDGESTVWWKGKQIDMPTILKHRKGPPREESAFFIPAQRVLVLHDGWPRPFSDYSPGVPFVVRDFSEKLRIFVERETRSKEELFPQERRLKRSFKEMLERSIFGSFRLRVDKVGAQSRLVLSAKGGPLPFMVWSAGQREFVPLLLGLYWLLPPGQAARRAEIEWAILEEPEMGLHPRAIADVVFIMLDLVARGYRVCISTHSPLVLEAIWALRCLKESGAPPRSLLDVFGASKDEKTLKVVEEVMSKSVKVYYFDAETGRSRDISDLNPESEEAGEAGWGGLAEFSGRANAAVAHAVANADGEG